MSESLSVEIAEAQRAFLGSYMRLLSVWMEFQERYEFRGLLRDMCLKFDLSHDAVLLYACVPQADKDTTGTISLKEPIRPDDTDMDAVVYRAIRRFLLHEAAEGFMVNGKHFDDPHAHDLSLPTIMSDDVEKLEKLLASAKKKLGETTL